MDSILIDDEDKLLYLAENCIRSLVTPLLIPSIVYSVITGILSVALYGKFVKKDYFLPYFYFGNAAMLYTVQHTFSLIFIKEETDVEKELLSAITKGKDGILDFTHESALYGSLLISTFGSFFLNLALFRLLEVWMRNGLQMAQHLSRYYLSVLSIIISCVPAAFQIVGDALLIIGAEKPKGVLPTVKTALALKLTGAICQVTLAVIFIILCLYCSWLVFFYTAVEKELLKEERARERLSVNTSLLSRSHIESQLIASASKEEEEEEEEKEQQQEANLSDATIIRISKVRRTLGIGSLPLLILGSLVLVRFVYDLYKAISIITKGPIWNIIPPILLVNIDTALLFLGAYFLDLPSLKTPVLYSDDHFRYQTRY